MIGQALDPEVAYDKKHRFIDHSTGRVFSKVLWVPVGYTILMSMYNYFNNVKLDTQDCCNPKLVNDSCITVHKVSYEKGKGLPSIPKYCDWIPKLNDVYKEMFKKQKVKMEEVCQCGSNWTLSPGNNYALLTIPGFYVLEIKDLTQIENCYIEYDLLTIQEASMIPDAFKLGA